MQKTFSAAIFLAGFLVCSSVQAESVFMKVDGVRKGDTLNIRSGPGASYEDIGDFGRKEIIRVIGYDNTGNWAKVRYRGQIAYVSAKFLKAAVRSDGTSTGTGNHWVTGIKANDPDGGLVVRDGDGRNFARIGTLVNGAKVHVIRRNQDGKWAMIAFGSDVGWVRSSYLNGTQTNAQATPQPMPSATPTTAPDGGPLPAMFKVTGVAPNDVLNFRDAPRASGTLLGGFRPGERLEVMSMASGNWAYVNNGETAGYVNIKFLTRANSAPAPTMQNGFPLNLACLGTEPFWTFEVGADRTVTYNSLGNGAALSAPLTNTTHSQSTGSYPYVFTASPYSGVLRSEQCNDGMSDNSFSMSLVLNAPNPNGGTATIYGCCNVQP